MPLTIWPTIRNSGSRVVTNIALKNSVSPPVISYPRRGSNAGQVANLGRSLPDSMEFSHRSSSEKMPTLALL